MSEKHGEKHGLRPQPHGGALRNGGPSKGGTGRPPNELRAASRESYAKLTEKLNEKLQADLSVTEITQAMNVTGKYGLGEAKVLVPEELTEALVEVLGSDTRIPAEAIADICAKLAEKLKTG